MKITKDNSTPEYPHIYFSGEFDNCALALNTQSTWLRFYIGSTLDDHILLSQEDIKALLPYLQSFVDSGTLEPQESPLQGESKEQALEQLIVLKDKISLEEQLSIVSEASKSIETLEKQKAHLLRQVDKQVDEIAELEDQLEIMQEAGVAMASNIVDQGKRIEALQNLVREWRKFSDKIAQELLEIEQEEDCPPWRDLPKKRRDDQLEKKTAQLLGEED